MILHWGSIFDEQGYWKNIPLVARHDLLKPRHEALRNTLQAVLRQKEANKRLSRGSK